MLMDASNLDRKITIERGVKSKNAARETVMAWSVLASLWANVQYPSSRHVLSSQQPQSDIDAVFTVRWRNDLTPTESVRVVYRGRYYRLVGVRETGSRNTFLALDATSRAE